MNRFRELLEEAAATVPTSPGEMLDFETRLHQDVARDCIDPVVGAVVQAAHDNKCVAKRAEELTASYPHLRLQKSEQTVVITLLGGSTVEVTTPYFLVRPPSHPGHKRKKGRRGKEGNGVYPRLAVLGIHFRASPALASVVAHHTALGTVQQTIETLSLRGIRLDPKSVSRIAQRVAERGLAYRDWLTEQSENLKRCSFSAAGKRLVIGIDGGRLRTRVARRGRRKANGRRGFRPEWREPKVFVIYEIDAKGRKMKGGLVRYDATMKNADQLFEILAAVLVAIGADRALEWTVVCDGADWIWDRVQALVEKVGFDPAKVSEVVDFYHASQRLYTIASMKHGWNEQRRAQWVRHTKKLLRHGKIEALLEAADRLCVGPRARAIRSLLTYFETHKERMRYQSFRQKRVPLGSGAVESGVRRVVNLRLKGNGIFWSERNAEGILHLRAQLLAGRWHDFVRTVMQHEVFWHRQSAQKPHNEGLRDAA